MWSWGTAEIEIARRPEDVWEWLVDPELLGRWLETEVEAFPADRSLLREGYQGREIVPLPGRGLRGQTQEQATITVTRYNPPRELATTTDMRYALMRSTQTLEPRTGGTLVRSRFRMRHRGVMVVFGPLVMGRVRAGLRDQMARLKTLAETGT